MTAVLHGRQSSHYTRVVRMFARELGVALAFEPIFELLSDDANEFAGNPALKLPVLRRGDDAIYGTMNICRVLAAGEPARIAWPESFMTPLMLNAHELVAHAMAAEVEVVFHELVKRPPDAASRKRRASLANCLHWFDAHLEPVRAELVHFDVSWFELSLFCMLEHLPFRNPMDLGAHPRLIEFVAEFGQRASAQATPYRFDQPDVSRQTTPVP